jgi:hypothetical protein
MSVPPASLRLLPVLCGVLVTACDRPSPPPPTDLGIPWELAEHRHRTISNLEYGIELEVPRESGRPVRGRTVMGFGWNDPDRHPLVIDFMRPGERVESVRANGVDAAWTPVEDHIVVDPQALIAGFNRVEIVYVAGDEALNRAEDLDAGHPRRVEGRGQRAVGGGVHPRRPKDDDVHGHPADSSNEDRLRRAGQVEGAMWSGATGSRPVTARASFLGTYRGVALTPTGVSRLERLWAGQERIPGLPLSESDETALAMELALREVEGWSTILDGQESRITNPDRRARFRFVRPSLDADPGVRRAFFESLRDPANREREPWVLAGLGNLHHPLRSASALPLIRPALDMIEEIQRTGDIFFPRRWLGAVLDGHNEAEAADTLVRFLSENPELPPRLRGKVLQSADMVWRSASIVRGWNR